MGDYPENAEFLNNRIAPSQWHIVSRGIPTWTQCDRRLEEDSEWSLADQVTGGPLLGVEGREALRMHRMWRKFATSDAILREVLHMDAVEYVWGVAMTHSSSLDIGDTPHRDTTPVESTLSGVSVGRRKITW